MGVDKLLFAYGRKRNGVIWIHVSNVIDDKL